MPPQHGGVEYDLVSHHGRRWRVRLPRTERERLERLARYARDEGPPVDLVLAQSSFEAVAAWTNRGRARERRVRTHLLVSLGLLLAGMTAFAVGFWLLAHLPEWLGR